MLECRVFPLCSLLSKCPTELGLVVHLGGRERQEVQEFKANLGCIVGSLPRLLEILSHQT